jgi:hypothetical protein
MTGDFAIVAEGFTDQVVIEEILLGWFADDEEEPVVNREWPRSDETGRNGGRAPGGWTLLKQYFERGDFRSALQFNRYLVVHIDADIAADFGITTTGLAAEEVVNAFVQRFRDMIGSEIWTNHGARFLFAIGVNSIECWLLPLVFDRSMKPKLEKINGCLGALNHERTKAKRVPLSTKDEKSKDHNVYREIARGLKCRADVEYASMHNPGFRRFVDDLIRISGDRTSGSAPPVLVQSDAAVIEDGEVVRVGEGDDATSIAAAPESDG